MKVPGCQIPGSGDSKCISDFEDVWVFIVRSEFSFELVEFWGFVSLGWGSHCHQEWFVLCTSELPSFSFFAHWLMWPCQQIETNLAQMWLRLWRQTNNLWFFIMPVQLRSSSSSDDVTILHYSNTAKSLHLVSGSRISLPTAADINH